MSARRGASPGGGFLALAALLAGLCLAVPGRGDAASLRLSFADAVRHALAHNVDVQVAAAQQQRVGGLQREALAAALPSLNGNAIYTELDHDRTLGPRLLVPGRSYNLTASVLLPLLAPRAWAGVRHAGDDLATSAAERRATERLVALQAARAYIDVITQLRLVAVNAQAVTTAQAHEADVSARLEAGIGTRLDALRAAQELGATQAQQEAYCTSLLRSREALALIVGQDSPCDVVPESLQLPEVVPPAPGDGQVLQLRQDVQAAQGRLRAAQRLHDDDWLSYLPSLQLLGQGFHQQPPTPTIPNLGWQLFLTLNLPLYDGGARYGQQRQHAAVLQQNRLQLDQVQRVARSELRAAQGALGHAQAARAAAARAAARAQEFLQLALDAYAAGTVNNLEVIDAERRARDAENAAVIAVDAEHQTRLELAAAAGVFPAELR